MKRLVLIVALLLVVAAGYGAYLLHQVVTVVVPDAYAVDWVSAMVIEHMKTNDGQWPRSWDDLRGPYEKLAAPQGYPWSFEELKDRVAVDWDADPKVLKKVTPSGHGPPFRVIWLRDGSSTAWEGAEPNSCVLEYLRTDKDG
jgi:hypothetical protein